MAASRADRRRTAVLAADAVGFARLMERNEDGTLARLKAHRRDLADPLIPEHSAGTVKLMGDERGDDERGLAVPPQHIDCDTGAEQTLDGREIPSPDQGRLMSLIAKPAPAGSCQTRRCVDLARLFQRRSRNHIPDATAASNVLP